MASFVKRSLTQVILLNICTIGIYSIYWAVITKRELNQAGGKVPNAFLVIIPLFNLYFWYRYAQGYVRLVKKNNEEREFWLYFLVCCLPTVASVVGLTRFVAGELSALTMLLNGFSFTVPTLNNLIMIRNFSIFTIVVLINLLTALAISSAKLTILQEGYNEPQG